MTSLSQEEENYVRISLLLTGISPRAVRTCFDSEFSPACLDATLKKEYNKLLDLKKKHRINQLQWNLLFPRFPDVPDSKTFDVSLMVALLRNLTKLIPPLGGYDCLPAAMETSTSADLARIKYYRNYLAHLDDGKVDTTYFGTMWTDITGAIGRLVGQQMKQECEHLKTKMLDQSNQEIMLDIKHSNIEIRELKESFESLNLSHTEMKKEHKLLQEDNAHLTKEMEKIMKSQNDTVPWNIRVGIIDTLKDWKNDDKMFIDTRAAQLVRKCIKENSCVTITASSGVGKTATLRHIALQMENEEYDIIIVTDPIDIINYNNPKIKTLFVFDDLCGNFSVDQTDIKRWDPVMENIKKILDRKTTKILAACRLQVYQDEKFESLSIFKSCVCNLLSENICLSQTEKQSIAVLYLNTKASEITSFNNLYDCFPLLCKLYHDNPILNITDFFQNPFSVYEAEIEKFFTKGHHTKLCALALCVMFNNKLIKEILTDDVNEGTKTIIENTCEACRLERGTSRLVLQDELESLKGTFIKKEQNIYKILHDKIFDFLAYIYGKKIIQCLIKNADSDLIKGRFLLERTVHMDQFTIIIPPKYHQMYIQRMIDDWSKGKVKYVFGNSNMKIPQFRQKFLIQLNTLDVPYQRKLAHICDEHKPYHYDEKEEEEDNYTYDNALLHCCYIGDISLVQWCCTHGVDINRCTYNFDQSPIMIVCKQGHSELLSFFINAGINYNKCNSIDESPLMKACEHGQREIVRILIERGADYNKCDLVNQSPVMKACEHGHKEIVKMLLDIGVNCSKMDIWGQSPVIIACQQGDREIVKMLLDEGVNCHRIDWFGNSLLHLACKHDDPDLLRMLLDKEVECNECNGHGNLPITTACKLGYTKLVRLLLDKGVDCNKSARHRMSPILTACEYGHTEIVKLLLDGGAHCNACDMFGESPVMKACQRGEIEIVKMLLDRGADCNICDIFGQSPVMKACECGHTKIVKMFLDRGVDCYNLVGKGQSPIMKV